jgi:hypothetical protein
MESSEVGRFGEVFCFQRSSGATRRDRTGDLLITNQPLYQTELGWRSFVCIKLPTMERTGFWFCARFAPDTPLTCPFARLGAIDVVPLLCRASIASIS